MLHGDSKRFQSVNSYSDINKKTEKQHLELDENNKTDYNNVLINSSTKPALRTVLQNSENIQARRKPPSYHYYVANIAGTSRPLEVNNNYDFENAGSVIQKISLRSPKTSNETGELRFKYSNDNNDYNNENSGKLENISSVCRLPRASLSKQNSQKHKVQALEIDFFENSTEMHPYEATQSPRTYQRQFRESRQTRVSDDFQIFEDRAEIRQRQLSARSILPLPESINEPTHRLNEGLASRNYWWIRSYHSYIFVSLAILQILVAVGLLAFSILRYHRTFQIFSRDKTGGILTLLDFEKAEDYAESTQEGTAIIAMKVCTSIFIPSLLQFCAGLLALFPLYRRPPKFYMILNIVCTAFAIVLWIESIYLAALELNLRNVQLNSFYNSANYRLSIGVITILAVDVLFAGSALAVYSASHLASASRMPNSALDAHLNTITLFAAIIALIISAYVTAISMTRVADWTIEGVKQPRDFVVLYSFGLKELIVTSYTVLSTLFTSIIALLRKKSLRLGVTFTQSVSLFCILNYLFNADRITAIIFNIHQITNAEETSPFSGFSLLVLYLSLCLLTIMLAIQIGSTIISVFPFPPVIVYATPLTLPYNTNADNHFKQSQQHLQTTAT